MMRSLRPLRRASRRSQPLAPLSAVQKVDRSWQIVSADLEGTGIQFFTRIFLSVPAALDLFLKVLNMQQNEMEAIKRSGESIRRFVRENRMIKAHARLVVMEVGRCVAGLYDMKVLVPRLRSLGRMHGAAGVKPEHYDLFFRHLLETVRDRILDVSPGDWDDSTAEAWETVGHCMHKVLTRPDESAGSVDGGGDLNRWGYVCGAASCYACVVTPLRVAGMIGHGNVMGASVSFRGWISSLRSLGVYGVLHSFGFALIDAAIAAIFFVELVGYILLKRIKVKDVRKVRNISSRRLQRANLYGKCVLIIRSFGIHEAVTFPWTDAIFLASYFLQYRGMAWVGRLTGSKEGLHSSVATLTSIGVHWAWGLGCLRLVAIFRAVYVMRCLELAYTVTRHPGSSTRTGIRIARLVLALAFTSHVAACLYVLVARIELGPQAYYDADRGEELATSFFPDYTILGEDNVFITNYLRCVHFAFTNLAGIGSHDSVPRSALECIFTLCVNALGATLYAFTTGNLLTMIEPAAERATWFANSASALADYMSEVGMSTDDQDRFIQGFILREMRDAKSSGDGDGGGDNGPFAASPGENAASPAYPVELSKHLPRHLQEELRAISLADALRRRERAFRRCSNGFLTVLASSLKQSICLLPGDFMVKEGQPVPTQLLIVEQGTLEVGVDGANVRTFQRGDMVSFRWITSTPGACQMSLSAGRALQAIGIGGTSVWSPLLLSDALAGASVRAMDHCRIAVGLSSKSEKKDIRKNYPSDWKELEEILDIARGRKKPRASLVDDAPQNGLHDGIESIDGSNGRHSLTKTIRRVSTAVQHAPKNAMKHIALME
ncbi:hypothetical protein ACHAXT_001860 [Thalassiosira profunda]